MPIHLQCSDGSIVRTSKFHPAYAKTYGIKISILEYWGVLCRCFLPRSQFVRLIRVLVFKLPFPRPGIVTHDVVFLRPNIGTFLEIDTASTDKGREYLWRGFSWAPAFRVSSSVLRAIESKRPRFPWIWQMWGIQFMTLSSTS